MILHRDDGQMPQRRAVWSSWVYTAETRRPQTAIGVTYWMNRLQNIPETDPLFVTLNPSTPVREDLIYDQTTFRHPVFDTRRAGGATEVARDAGRQQHLVRRRLHPARFSRRRLRQRRAYRPRRWSAQFA